MGPPQRTHEGAMGPWKRLCPHPRCVRPNGAKAAFLPGPGGNPTSGDGASRAGPGTPAAAQGGQEAQGMGGGARVGAHASPPFGAAGKWH